MLSDSQMERLRTATEIIRADSGNQNWDERLAIGNNHMSEMILIMLENYIEANIKKKHP